MGNDVVARNVLVVIGSGGMGVAAARRLDSGHKVVLADASHACLEAAVTTLEGEGHSVDGHMVDVSDRRSVEKLAAAAGGAVGHVDAVIHTAGVSPVTATPRQIYEVDLLGTAHVVDAFLPVAGPGTSLVCIASMAGHFASLSADLERHLAVAPADQLLGHPEIDLNAPDSGTAYVVAKRGNHLRVQAAAAGMGTEGSAAEHRQSRRDLHLDGRGRAQWAQWRVHAIDDRCLRSPAGRHPRRHCRRGRVPGRAGLVLHHRERHPGRRRGGRRAALEHDCTDCTDCPDRTSLSFAGTDCSRADRRRASSAPILSVGGPGCGPGRPAGVCRPCPPV